MSDSRATAPRHYWFALVNSVNCQATGKGWKADIISLPTKMLFFLEQRTAELALRINFWSGNTLDAKRAREFQYVGIIAGRNGV